MFHNQKKFILLLVTSLFTATFLNAEDAEAPATPLMANELLENMAPHLIKTSGEKVTVNLKEKEHVLIYWSASWCGPCRNFTPKLVEFYNQNGGGKKFEILLMCLDRSEEKMAAYMKSSKMPWPAISFDQKANTGAKAFVKTNIKGGIPRLMIINKKGEVLAAGNAYSVLPKFKEIIAKAS
jgi:thiol-disulfide isomerase/thioredoxin